MVPVSLFVQLETNFGTVTEPVALSAAHVATRPNGPLIIATAEGSLGVVAAEDTEKGIGRDELIREYLTARVVKSSIVGDEIRLVIASEQRSAVSAVRFWREVDGTVLSRSFACNASPDGDVTAGRIVRDVVNRRWLILATFDTPLGPIEYPVRFDRDAVQDVSADFTIRALGTAGIQVVRAAQLMRAEGRRAVGPLARARSLATTWRRRRSA
jgi:hypothetical protein